MSTICHVRYEGRFIIEGVLHYAFWYGVHQPYTMFWDDEETESSITVPAGYLTDLASVPRFMWGVIAPHDNRIAAAAVCHDFLYQYHMRARAYCDDLLYAGMEALGAPWRERWAVWCGVRIGGQHAYETGPARAAARTELPLLSQIPIYVCRMRKENRPMKKIPESDVKL